jgi:hypothetical protein
MGLMATDNADPDESDGGRSPDKPGMVAETGAPNSDERRIKAPRIIRLRYAGTCEVCETSIAARAQAWYDSGRKKVRCMGCEPSATVSDEPVRDQSADATDSMPALQSDGVAGASARRKYEHLSQRYTERAEAAVAKDAEWREQVKKDHPFLGRIAAAATAKPVVGPEPQRVTAWQTGSHGEVWVGGVLDKWATGTGGFALHDRRIPGTKANIDHLAVTPTGVWVIDAKEYKGAVEKVDVGGWLRSDVRLRVDGRDRSKLLDGVEWQVSRVTEALARLPLEPRPPVHGALCFVGCEWPRFFAKPLTVRGITVLWPAAVADLLCRPGSWQADHLERLATTLAEAFPPA